MFSGDFPGISVAGNPPANAEDMCSVSGLEDSTYHWAAKPVQHSYWACALELVSSNYWSLAMTPHSSTLAQKIPWMEEPGRLQSMGLLRVGHDWATSLSLSTFMHVEGNGNSLQYSCLENLMDGEAWWAAVHGVAQSRTRLKRLSRSSAVQSLCSTTVCTPQLEGGPCLPQLEKVCR